MINNPDPVPPPPSPHDASLPPDACPTDPEPDYDSAVNFLQRWTPDRLVLLCAIEPDSPRITARTFEPQDAQGMRRWLERYGATRNLYFGVNPVRGPIAKKPERTDIAEVRWLHVDLDPDPGKPFGQERERILDLLRSPTDGIPPPTVITDSGGGFQAFWRMVEPRVLSGTLDDAVDAARCNQRLEQVLGGDHCHNVDRIMRVPGSLNRPHKGKRAKGRQLALARLVEWHE